MFCSFARTLLAKLIPAIIRPTVFWACMREPTNRFSLFSDLLTSKHLAIELSVSEVSAKCQRSVSSIFMCQQVSASVSEVSASVSEVSAECLLAGHWSIGIVLNPSSASSNTHRHFFIWIHTFLIGIGTHHSANHEHQARGKAEKREDPPC